MTGKKQDDGTANGEALLTEAEVAKRLSRSRSYLAKLRCTGGGPVYLKLGRSVLYRWADVEKWLASRRRRSTSED